MVQACPGLARLEKETTKIQQRTSSKGMVQLNTAPASVVDTLRPGSFPVAGLAWLAWLAWTGPAWLTFMHR